MAGFLIYILENYYILISTYNMVISLQLPVDDIKAKTSIQRCTKYIVDTLEYDDIKDGLISHGILTSRQINRIEDEKGDANKLNEVVSKLVKTDLSITFIPFLTVLDECGGIGSAGKTCKKRLENSYKDNATIKGKIVNDSNDDDHKDGE